MVQVLVQVVEVYKYLSSDLRVLACLLGQLNLVLALSLVPHCDIVGAAHLLVDHLVLALVFVQGLLHLLAHCLIDKVTDVSVESLDNILTTVDKIIRANFLELRLNNIFTLFHRLCEAILKTYLINTELSLYTLDV